MTRKSPQTLSAKKTRLAVRLLRVVFSIYLTITVLITTVQMLGEYWREQNHIESVLTSVQAIFSDSLTTAVWTFDAVQLAANLDGILKMPTIVGIKIDGIDKLPDWKRPFPIRLGTVTNDDTAQNTTYFQLVPYSFQLKRNNILLATVTLYSSYVVIFNAIKYDFLAILIAALIKTIILWLLFLWAFQRFLGKQLAVFCQTMDNADIDDVQTTFLKLETNNIDELCRIEQTYNNLFQRVIEKNNALHELNISLDYKVAARTKKLEALIQDKNDFLSIAAHDLKNPLITIRSFTQLITNLLQKDADKNKLIIYTHFIETRAKTMCTLIDNLLNAEKIDAGMMTVDLTEVNINSLIKNVIDNYSDAIATKKISLELYFSEADFNILTDEFLLMQIFDNLLSNAIKFSPIEKSIIMRLTHHDAYIHFDIQDQGQGFSVADKKKLFTKFSRLSAKPTANEDSTGFGLFIVKKLTTLLNIDIHCESSPQQGTIFSLKIPITHEKSMN